MAFVVCVSAAPSNADETFSSLHFASRAVTVQQTNASSQRHNAQHQAAQVAQAAPSATTDAVNAAGGGGGGTPEKAGAR